MPRPVTTVQDARITESSGLAASSTRADVVWTVNDSGSSAVVYGVSLRTGRTVARLTLAGTQARDWEAMTAARVGNRSLLWIGDVGDNRAVRKSVVLRLVREPARWAPQNVTSQTVTPVSLRVRYPDGPHDVETLIWTPEGRLLLVSKGLFTGVVYEVPPPAVTAALAGRSTTDPVVAVPLATVAMSLVTDGAALPDGRIVLRGYADAAIYPDPRAGGTLTPASRVSLPAQPQGETIAVVERGRAVLVGSEGVRQPLYRVALPGAATGPTPTSAPTATLTSAPTPTAAPTTPTSALSATPAPSPASTANLPGREERVSTRVVALVGAGLMLIGLLVRTITRRRRRRGRR